MIWLTVRGSGMDVVFEFTHFMQSKSVVFHRLSWGQCWRSSPQLEMEEIASKLFVGIEVLYKSDRLVV